MSWEVRDRGVCECKGSGFSEVAGAGADVGVDVDAMTGDVLLC